MRIGSRLEEVTKNEIHNNLSKACYLQVSNLCWTHGRGNVCDLATQAKICIQYFKAIVLISQIWYLLTNYMNPNFFFLDECCSPSVCSRASGCSEYYLILKSLVSVKARQVASAGSFFFS